MWVAGTLFGLSFVIYSLFKNLNINKNRNIILSVALCGCYIQFVTWRDKYKYTFFQNKILRIKIGLMCVGHISHIDVIRLRWA